DSPMDRAAIAEVLCTFIRTRTRSSDTANHSIESPTPTELEHPILAVRAPDVQAALTVLARWRTRLGEPPADLNFRSANLRGAGLIDAELQGAVLTNADLRDASLLRAQQQDAFLWGAKLSGASLLRANLRGVHYLEAADLSCAKADSSTAWPDGW